MSIPQTPGQAPDPIEDAKAFLDSDVRPHAGDIDIDREALGRALDAMAERNLLGLRVPEEYGGKGLAEKDFRRFQEACARVSGCLAFLQTQHQSGCSMIARGDNEGLKREMLPKLASGKNKCGIAFSQLRKRSAEPVLAAREEGTQVILTGSAPWVTGLGFFDYCVTAATLKDGDTIFLLHRLEEAEGLGLSEPMALASMEPAQTVSATFADYRIPIDKVVARKPGNWIENNDMINIALQSPFALGCAQAGLDIVAENYRRKDIPAIKTTLAALTEELARCRTEAYGAMDEKDDLERSLRARGWAVELALRCAAAGVVTSSGAGNSTKHPAQRVYREALVFSVSAQTADIMSATLERITRTSA
ncbi:MAG: acyl-CoA dehydrogenase family protein [Fimbriimonadales bacterium]